MGFWIIFKNDIIKIIHSRAIVVLIIASVLLVPLFVYDNSSIEKNVSNNYYMGSMYPLDAVPLSHSESFLLLGNDLTGISEQIVKFNITVCFMFTEFGGINSTPSITSNTWTVNYNATSGSGGDVIINNTLLSDVLLKLEISRMSNMFFNSNDSVTITGYTLNSYKLVNGLNQQTDTFFAFKGASISSGAHNFTVYYATMPSSTLGSYGNTEIFYSPNAPSSGYYITEGHLPFKTEGLYPPKGTYFRFHVKSGQVFSIINRNRLLSINSQSSMTFYIDNFSIAVNIGIIKSETHMDSNYLLPISGALVIFVSALYVLVGVSPMLNSETRKRYLLLPPRRSVLLLSGIASTLVTASIVASAIFGVWSAYTFLLSGKFYSFWTLIYCLITLNLIMLAQSSIYLLGIYSHRKATRFYIDVSLVSVIPLIFIAIYGYIYFYVTTYSGSVPLYSVNLLLEPLRGGLYLYNVIISLIPVFSPLQLNNYLLNVPVFGAKMPEMNGVFGIDPLFIIPGSIVFPFCIMMLGLFLLRKGSEEAE
jgi:Signal transduction histidine kinase involved in nitrogen fixation and metabolism regulation